MVRRGAMEDIGAARSRQMASDAVVVAASSLPDCLRELTAPIDVALQAALPEVGDLLAWFGQPMRIVAGDTPKAASTRAEATALVHLLDMVDEPILRIPGGREHDPELMERQPRPKVLIPAIQSLDPLETAQVTLLADRITQRGLEGSRVDDRDVAAVDHRGPPDVKLARTVAPLAADRMAPEDRWLIAIDCTGHVLDTICVAE